MKLSSFLHIGLWILKSTNDPDMINVCHKSIVRTSHNDLLVYPLSGTEITTHPKTKQVVWSSKPWLTPIKSTTILEDGDVLSISNEDRHYIYNSIRITPVPLVEILLLIVLAVNIIIFQRQYILLQMIFENSSRHL